VANGPDGDQLNVPCSTTTGAEEGADIDAPPSPHDPQAGAHAGSCTGPQAGWQGWAMGATPPEQGERNSMNEGRRQLFELPKQLLQLLQPEADARLPRAITRHRVRHMVGISTTTGPESARGRTQMRRPRRRLQTLAHDPARGGGEAAHFQKKVPAAGGPSR